MMETDGNQNIIPTNQANAIFIRALFNLTSLCCKYDDIGYTIAKNLPEIKLQSEEHTNILAD